jgi:hypothetical protein
MTSNTCAIPPTAVPTQIVLNRPHFVSATIPPAIGITYARKENIVVIAEAATDPSPKAPAVWFKPASPGGTAPAPFPPIGKGLLIKLLNGPGVY